MRVEKSIEINKPAAEVFEYLQNFDNATKWQHDVVSTQMIEGASNAVGSRYTESRKFLNKEMKTTLEITAFDKNKKWGAKVIEGPVTYEITITFTEIPQGTKLTTVVEGEPKGFFKLAENMVANALGNNLEESQQNLKSLLESK